MNKLFFILSLLLFFSCKEQVIAEQEHGFVGQTMGTTYSVKYVGASQPNLQQEINELLVEINQSVSTYIPTSTISKINQASKNTSIATDHHFIANYKKAAEIYENTGGAFNPAIMPLVNYYGFGFEKIKGEQHIDTTEVQAIHAVCDFNNFVINDKGEIEKLNAQSQLDFSAIAKGYGVDEVARFLIAKGIDNFLVEIGGEGYAQGVNGSGNVWKFGIRRPSAAERTAFVKAVAINKRGIATSGNYENFRELDNHAVIGHTIDPKTGFAQSLNESLLSVTVIANDCMTADAYATAFKAMGRERALKTAGKIDSIEYFFIYKNAQGEISTHTTLKE